MLTKHQQAETKKYLSFVTYIYEIFSVEERHKRKTLVHSDTNTIEMNQLLTSSSTLLFICMESDGTRVSMDSYNSKEWNNINTIKH